MSQDNVPQTEVQEMMVRWSDVLPLSVTDGVAEVMRKGLYRVAPTKMVAILAEDAHEVLWVGTADDLKGNVLPRTWDVLGNWVHNRWRAQGFL